MRRKYAGQGRLALALVAVFLIVLLTGMGVMRPSLVRTATLTLQPVRSHHHQKARPRSKNGIAPIPRATRIPTPHPRVTAAELKRQAEAHARALWMLHQDFYLHGVGTQLYTAWNTRITLKAINWYGFEYPPYVPGGLDHASLDSILSLIHRLGFNSLRLTFANATVEQNPIVTSGLDANPRLRGLHALDIMDQILKRAHDFHLRVILCDSRSEPGFGPEILSGLWYTNKYPEATWQADWLELATRFRHDSAFVGADLRNEPHITGSTFDMQSYFKLGPLWGAFNNVYYRDRDWHYAAETLGNELLKVNPNLLIVVEGVQMYYDPFKKALTGALWGSNLIGVQYDPIVLNRPSQLVYSVHEYGPKMWPGDWFSANSSYQQLAARWTNLWGYLLTAPRFMQAPILVGEFGTCDDWYVCVRDPTHPARQGFWFQNFVRYLQSHPQVGWAYWALNPDGPFEPDQRDFYSLMMYDWRHYYPLITYGLAPLLKEPNG